MSSLVRNVPSLPSADIAFDPVTAVFFFPKYEPVPEVIPQGFFECLMIGWDPVQNSALARDWPGLSLVSRQTSTKRDRLFPVIEGLGSVCIAT
jgi:hypothetical protein